MRCYCSAKPEQWQITTGLVECEQLLNGMRSDPNGTRAALHPDYPMQHLTILRSFTVLPLIHHMEQEYYWI
jgi:hypothetical protein